MIYRKIRGWVTWFVWGKPAPGSRWLLGLGTDLIVVHLVRPTQPPSSSEPTNQRAAPPPSFTSNAQVTGSLTLIQAETSALPPGGSSCNTSNYKLVEQSISLQTGFNGCQIQHKRTKRLDGDGVWFQMTSPWWEYSATPLPPPPLKIFICVRRDGGQWIYWHLLVRSCRNKRDQFPRQKTKTLRRGSRKKPTVMSQSSERIKLRCQNQEAEKLKVHFAPI